MFLILLTDLMRQFESICIMNRSCKFPLVGEAGSSDLLEKWNNYTIKLLHVNCRVVIFLKKS